MDTVWLFVKYILLVGVVIYSANKLGKYVDEMDKKTKLGAAFIGGVFLAMVTSLPEFITSISATLVYNEPGLAFGNVLGSNMFNMLILASADLLFVRYFLMNKIASSKNSNRLLILIYLMITIPMVFIGISNFSISVLTIRIFRYTISGISIAIILLYVLSVKYLSNENGNTPKEEKEKTEVDINENSGSVRKIILLFVFWSAILVISAVYITGITNDIYKVLGISSSFAGAIFLGIATSVPELTTVFALVKLKNFSAAASNVVGSNVFNFLVLSIVDILYFKENIFDEILTEGSTEQNVFALLILGLINSIILLVVMVRKPPKRKFFYMLPSILIILLYGVYLIISFTLGG